MTKEIASVWIFRSESSAGKEYETLQYADGTTSCNCPGWRFKKKTTATGDRTCKHTREIDLGTADRHASNKIEYAVAAKRTRQRANTPTPEPMLSFQPNRMIRLED